VPRDATAQAQTIRQLLNRRDLASARHRSGLSRQLGLTDSEMLAVAYLAQRGELRPAELGELLGLTSGAITALVRRLEDGGHLVRSRHPTDGRSVLVHLADALVERAEAAFDPLVRDLDDLAVQLEDEERASVERFLAQVARVSESHAERVIQRPARRAEPATVPGLWG
jgi:DNA-binding MarR family transcriptional regulator